MSKYVIGINHVGIFTPDRDKSLKFYTDVFGFEHVFSVDNQDNSGFYISVMKKGNMVIELLQLVEEDPTVISAAKSTLNHMAFACTNMKELVNELKVKGIEFETSEDAYVPNFGNPPKDIDIIFLRGPSGERIELYEEIELN